jgi:outer membrane protein assembly factor BamB
MWGRKETDPHLWKVCTKSGILLSGGYLYYGVDSGHFLCVDEMTGKEVWRYVIPGIGRNTEVFSKPVEHKDSVIFGSQDGNVYALSKQTGERVWTYVDADWVNGSLAISLRHGLVYVGLSYGFLKKRGKVVALEIHNGKVRWEIETKNLISSGVFYSKKKNYIYFSEVDGTVTVVHARNGRVLWSRVVDLDSVTAPILVEKTNEIVVAGLEKERGKISILSADTGVTKITSEIFSFGLVNNPIVFDGVIYISSLDKNLYAIDQKTGKLKMTFFFGSRVFSDPYIFTDKNNKKKLFIGANDARLYEIDMETLRAISVTYFTERITDPVVVSDDRSSLYLMTYANEVYKLAL